MMARRIRDRVFGPEDDPGRWAEAMERAGIPRRYQDATVEGVKNAQAREWVKERLSHVAWRQNGTGYVLVGPYGSGKSSIAGLIAVDSVRRCETTLWLSAADVPGVMFRDGKENARKHDLLQRADILILDDLGAEAYSMERAGGSALERCIRILYDARRPIIVTSNLSPGRIKDAYPAPLVSVLERTTQMVVIE